MQFEHLGLIEPLLQAVRSEGYTTPTAIQEQAIPHILQGRDWFGCAQTGTGKTAAFALPILQLLHGRPAVHKPPHGHATQSGRPIRALIVTPTRELAAQIGQSFAVYGQHAGLRHTVIYGGVGQGPQAAALRKGVDILVATPGRLLDLLNQQLLSLRQVEIFVLDEADRMLDMGFIHDIRRVVAQLPPQRQNLMFSATMPREIRALADTILHRPIEVRIASQSPAADTVNQVLYFVETGAKQALLEHLLEGPEITRALVFTRTKHGANKVAKQLVSSGTSAEAIHSNKSQNARMRALESFKRGFVRVLVASDIASRGLDVDDISHVINFDMPNVPETYVHRIGRTGRAGASGQAISFCSGDQREELRDIERLLRRSIPVLPHSIKAPPAQPRTSQPRTFHGQGHKPAGQAHKPTGQAHRPAGPSQQHAQPGQHNTGWRRGRNPRRGSSRRRP